MVAALTLLCIDTKSGLVKRFQRGANSARVMAGMAQVPDEFLERLGEEGPREVLEVFRTTGQVKPV